MSGLPLGGTILEILCSNMLNVTSCMSLNGSFLISSEWFSMLTFLLEKSTIMAAVFSSFQYHSYLTVAVVHTYHSVRSLEHLAF